MWQCVFRGASEFMRRPNGRRSNDRYECTISVFIDKNSRDNNNGNKEQRKTGTSSTRVIENIASELNQCLT